jgi:hypothetical protein
MNLFRPLSIFGFALAALLPTSGSAELPAIPQKPIAEKKEILFEDTMDGTTHDAKWHRVVDTFTWENNMLKGTQTRLQNTPSADGKSVITAHAAVYGLELPTKDSVVDVKIKFDGCTMMDVEFDDRKFVGSHYGHLCRAQVRLDKIVILDERDGTQSNALIELRKDPVANKDAINKLVASHSATFPAALEAGKWYQLTVEVAGDAMRVSIDGKPLAFFSSPGIGHATKSKIELGVAGQSGWFDDIKVWNAAPAK